MVNISSYFIKKKKSSDNKVWLFFLLKQYECLVEGCGVKLKSYKSRHQHLMDKHKFPSTYEFLKKSHPSKKERVKKYQCKQKHVADEGEESSAMQVEEETLDGLVSGVSKLTTSDSSPSVVSFGRRHTRGLTFLPRSVQRETKK